MTLTGSATAEGTARYRDRFKDKSSPNHFRSAQELLVSSIGIGTYLGNPDDLTDDRYVESIVSAVQNGANVIDTASNYRFQRSERAIGKALAELTANLGFKRDEIVICTKGGYLPFDNEPPRNMREYFEETFVKPGIASFEDVVGGSHCMTPSYLQNQLDQSLRNMDLESVDVYYIHNPESQLGHVSPDEFYHRLRLAFERLEENRKHGKLQFYGVATWNGFRQPTRVRTHHSLGRMIEIAREVGGEDHGFRFIQLPVNLAMQEAIALVNETIDGEPLTVVAAAARLGVTVIASGSMMQGRLAMNAQTAIQSVRSAPGITTALVGMGQVEHVDENLHLVSVEPDE